MTDVVVVDDDDSIRESLADVFTVEGFKVAAVPGGAEALQLLSQLEAPCVVLLDLLMPRTNGYDVLEEISRWPDRDRFRFIVISASEDLQRAATYPNVEAVMRKPFEIRNIIDRVILLRAEQAARLRASNV